MKNGNQIIAVWGSPGVGKTITSMKLARELSAEKKNVVVLLCDTVSPSLPIIQPEGKHDEKSLGELLALPSISQEKVLSYCTIFNKNQYISLLGFKNGDNSFTYPKYSKARAVDMIILLRHIADNIIIDCSSHIADDVLSVTALENADTVLRLCGCDLKSLSYFSSHLPLIADSRFHSVNHVKALSNVKQGFASGEYYNAYGGTSHSLPYVQELEEQFYTAHLLNGLADKNGKTYEIALRNTLMDLLGGNIENEKKGSGFSLPFMKK